MRVCGVSERIVSDLKLSYLIRDAAVSRIFPRLTAFAGTCREVAYHTPRPGPALPCPALSPVSSHPASPSDPFFPGFVSSRVPVRPLPCPPRDKVGGSPLPAGPRQGPARRAVQHRHRTGGRRALRVPLSLPAPSLPIPRPFITSSHKDSFPIPTYPAPPLPISPCVQPSYSPHMPVTVAVVAQAFGTDFLRRNPAVSGRDI